MKYFETFVQFTEGDTVVASSQRGDERIVTMSTIWAYSSSVITGFFV